MSIQSHISLIDLTKQFKFYIDEDIKKKLSFDETLVVSCAHCDGTFEDESSDSEWSCTESSESKTSVQRKDQESSVKNSFDQTSSLKEEVEEEENDFHFYFFPDCNKPTPSNDDKGSLIVVDGFPKINKKYYPLDCTCAVDKTGKCPCHFNVPCECGAQKRDECICQQAENICICEDTPRLTCKCKPRNVCLCYPGSTPRPICTCATIDKPCICKPGKYPHPICVCEHKPDIAKCLNKNISDKKSEILKEVESTKQPCTCQKPLPKPLCLCVKGKECICKDGQCICGVQPSCLCQPTEEKEIFCKDDDSKTICSCPVEPECKCYNRLPNDCVCFPKSVPECTCGNPEDCTCCLTCECKEPCLCDIAPQKENICICEDTKTGDLSPSDSKEGPRKLKKVRAGKHGYRWCHDVDPKHTYFDFAYDRHGKISYKEQEKQKIKILGLYEKPQRVEKDSTGYQDHRVSAYKKKVRKPSIDCCSAVGGISISVETLGEDKDKFLIQVVSNASREGAKTGSKLVSIIDCNLHTLEENRTEHITKKDITKEHRSYMSICENGYYNKVTRICGERHFVKRLYHAFEKAHNFLLEGANVVLLRYFGISRFCGHVKTDTVLINGTICESVYVCLGVSQAIVNGQPLFVSKVERHIIEPSGFIHQTLTVLTLRGYLVSHEWADSCYIFHINPLLRVVPEKDEIEPHEPLREKWRTDLQLLSDYLDFKSTRSSEGARYVAENGELTGVIRDYLQTLLLLRPHDAIHFTRHYFSSAMSALDLPHNEYFDPCSKHVRYYFFEE